MEPVFQSSISAHAWNKEHSLLAISPNTPEIWIFDAQGENPKQWKKKYTLEGHFMTVTGIDWNHAINAIATSGQDRNAYVWTYEKNENKWKPTLVVLRIGRAATCVRWSPNGKKFCVGSGSKQIPVCHYESSQDMWVAKMIKKAGKSSILAVDWSPNNLFIIAGGSDFKCRVFSAYIKGVDSDCKIDNYGSIDANKASKFGETLCEFDQSQGWVESCRFSPNGLRFAFTGHNSTIHFGSFENNSSNVQSLNRKELPLTALAFLSDTMVVAAGYDCTPILYEYSNNKWIEKGPIDTGKTVKAAPVKKKSAFSAAQKMFEQKSKLGSANATENPGLKTRHQNCINDIIVYSNNKFTTSSVDGRVLFWDATKSY